jgi:hypothetical protein
MANFQDFHKFLNLWEKHLNNDFSDKIKSLLDGNELILFFIKDDEVYGTDEDNRVTFARIMHPTADDGKEWAKEANFGAFNLTKALNGNKSKSIFGLKNAKEITVVDRKKAEEKLLKQAERAGGPIITSLTDDNEDSSIPPNMTNLKDKK